MPYKNWESLVNEECVFKWGKELNPNTAKNYVYYFVRYLDWAKERGYWNSAQEMLDEYKKLPKGEEYKHLDALIEYVSSLDTGLNDRKNRFQAVRSFYEYHRCQLPKLSRAEAGRIFRPSEADKKRAIELKPLEIDEVRRIILNAPMPYKAALMVVFQSAMGPSEFNQFNTRVWKKMITKLDEDGPIRVDLIREKVSKQSVKRYYTFISDDAKQLLKEWLEMRPDCESSALFVTYNKNLKKHVPVTGRLLGNMLLKIAKKLGLVENNGLNAYHIHLHEFRDLFKSICTIKGVNRVASEFFLGHTIDKLGYDKSPWYDENFFREEYKKIEPELNILSNTGGMNLERAKEEVKKEVGELIINLQKENKELKEQLSKLEKVVKVIAKVAMEDPSLLPVMKEFLKD